MSVRFATADEITRWDQLAIASAGGNVFSSTTYASIKKMQHYTTRFLMVSDLPVLVLEKSVPFFGKLWYLPKGPLVADADALQKTVAALQKSPLSKGVFMIKVESELLLDTRDSLLKNGFMPSAPVIPNPSTIRLDISGDEEALLNSLPQKGRHAIRRAGRDGVTVERVEATDENCHQFFALLKETSEGQFGLRPAPYYTVFWQAFAAAGQGQLFFAKKDGAVVAGAFAMVYGKKSTYKDGASVRQRTAYGASHLLQWEVIRWAREHKAVLHDFCGSPPSASVNDESHPLYGVGRFKLSFSKDVIDYIGCLDYPLRSGRYTIWKQIGERLTKSLYYRIHNDYYY